MFIKAIAKFDKATGSAPIENPYMVNIIHPIRFIHLNLMLRVKLFQPNKVKLKSPKLGLKHT